MNAAVYACPDAFTRFSVMRYDFGHRNHRVYHHTTLCHRFPPLSPLPLTLHYYRLIPLEPISALYC